MPRPRHNKELCKVISISLNPDLIAKIKRLSSDNLSKTIEQAIKEWIKQRENGLETYIKNLPE